MLFNNGYFKGLVNALVKSLFYAQQEFAGVSPPPPGSGRRIADNGGFRITDNDGFRITDL